MQEKRAFGVGCFHFGYRRDVPYLFKTHDYISALRAALAELPSVSEVKVDCDETMDQSFEVREDYRGLSANSVFPYVYFLRVTFSVYIPYRVQAALTRRSEEMVSSGTEHFSVVLVNAYNGPVVFVEGVGAGPDCRPSTFVQIVREFLTKEFERIKSGIVFDCMGPSPFHADFFLEVSSDEVQLSCQKVARRGYDRLLFTYSSHRDVPSDDDLEMLYYEITPEFGVFYSIKRRNVSFMDRWEELVGSWEELRSLVESEPSIVSVRKRARIHANSKELISNAFSFLVELDLAKQHTEAELVSLYDKGTPVYLEDYVRAAPKGKFAYPVESILEWGKYQSEASYKQAEIAAVIVSALLGGVIGATLTAFFR